MKTLLKILFLIFPICVCVACSSPPEPPIPVGPRISVNSSNLGYQTALVQDFVNKETPQNKNEFDKITNYRK